MSSPLPSDMSLEAFLGLGSALTAVTGLCIIIRIAANWRQSTEHIGDVFSVIALALLAGTVATFSKIITATSNPLTPLDTLIPLNDASNWIGSLAMWTSKIPILILYIHLFGVKLWVQIVSYFTMAASGIIFITMAGLTASKCNPKGAPIDLPFVVACSVQAAKSGFTLGMTSVLTDAIIFVLPIPLIVRLKLSTQKKIGLCVVFSGGLIAIVASGVSAHFKRRSMEGKPDGTIGSMMCTVIECAIALMVACVPAVYSFWSRVIVPSSLYSRLSAMSQRSLVRIGNSKTTSSSQYSRSKPANGSSVHINDSSYRNASHNDDYASDVMHMPPYSVSNKPFVVPALDFGHIVVVPQQQIKQVYGLPESILDVHNVQNESMQMHYTFPDPLLHQDPLHINVVRNQLTRNIPNLTKKVAEEINFGFDRVWGKDSKWRDMHVWNSSLGIMAGAANGAFCGQPLCRNIVFLERLKHHAMTIFGGSIGLSCLPSFIQPVLGPLLTLITHIMALRVTSISRPFVKERLEQTARARKDPTYKWTPPEDALQWMIDECYASSKPEEHLTLKRLCNRLLLVNDVSLLTTSYTAQNVILDLFSTDPKDGYVDKLREECKRALKEGGGVWTPGAVKKLQLVDSAIRESMRLNPFGTLLLPRKVVSTEGIAMEGWAGNLPQGSRIALPVQPIHHDENNYPDPHTYNPFRFVEFGGDDIMQVKQLKSTVTLDDSFMSFGVPGRNACPGRFFALLETKIYVATVLLNYDVQFLPSRPEPVHMMWMRYPSDAKLRVRRRAVTEDDA
ncbi:Cytochrome P450 monooxygenase gloP [Paramyrothecium foliicola]|nr:Cytochrome P450 monooxygenase gloP [Paramyrothecium foliicola]